MKVFVLIPVFNRLEHTKKVIESLRQQQFTGQLEVVVINDGSTDGTQAYLEEQEDVTQLLGNGHLWWGGAIEMGLRYALKTAADKDYVLFLNNDTWFGANYLQTLVNVSQDHGGAAVGSAIHEKEVDPPLVSIGPKINLNRIAVWDEFSVLSTEEICNPKATYQVDALSGRGTLYPAVLFRQYGTMRTWALPHYFADYEIAMRFARDAKISLVVSTKAFVYSPPVYGNAVLLPWWKKMFGKRSATNVIYKLSFYLLVGSPIQRLTAPLRLALFALSRSWARLNQKKPD